MSTKTSTFSLSLLSFPSLRFPASLHQCLPVSLPPYHSPYLHHCINASLPLISFCFLSSVRTLTSVAHRPQVRLQLCLRGVLIRHTMGLLTNTSTAVGHRSTTSTMWAYDLPFPLCLHSTSRCIYNWFAIFSPPMQVKPFANCFAAEISLSQCKIVYKEPLSQFIVTIYSNCCRFAVYCSRYCVQGSGNNSFNAVIILINICFWY